MTPTQFTKRMAHLCRDVGDPILLKKAGARLMVEALGDNAEAYMLGMEKLFATLQELSRKPKRYGASVESLQGRDV